MTTTLHGKDILRTDTLTDEELNLVLSSAAHFQERLEGGERLETMAGQLMAAMFFEPSTRTRLSFEAAMHRLGGAQHVRLQIDVPKTLARTGSTRSLDRQTAASRVKQTSSGPAVGRHISRNTGKREPDPPRFLHPAAE